MFLKDCKAGKVYISAFPDFKEFKKHTSDIAWDSEVWLMDFPEHMIHFNGDRFMGPR
jgi:type II restriction enzyme